MDKSTLVEMFGVGKIFYFCGKKCKEAFSW